MRLRALIPGRTGAILAAVAAGLFLASGLAVVRDNEQAVIVRIDEPERVINRFAPERPGRVGGAGLVFHLPLVERLVRLPRGLMSVTGEGLTLDTADRQTLAVDADATLRIVDPVRLVRRLGTAEAIPGEVGAWLPGLLRDALGGLDAVSIQLPGSAGGAARLRGALDAKLRDYGIQVIDLRLVRVALPATAQRNAIEAMREEREQLARDERVGGAREIDAITSQAEIDAAAILQASAGRDPQFYEFYRALRSYETIFADPKHKDRATIVLPPDSGYLRQFNGR